MCEICSKHRQVSRRLEDGLYNELRSVKRPAVLVLYNVCISCCV